MKVLITGATGFVGKAMVRALLARGDHVIVVGRARAKIEFTFQAEPVQVWTWIDLEQKEEPVDVIINLAGENIAGWWTRAKKNKILDSRLAATKRIVAFCGRQMSLGHVPIRLLQASGVGIFGIEGRAVYDESSPILEHADFLSGVARRVEATAAEAEAKGIPVTVMRFGVVLDPNGGLLEQLFPTFKYGFGAILGSGQQFMSWITRADLIRAILFIIDHPELTGAVHLVAKEPVTQATFAKRYAQYLGRPLFLHFPKWLISLLLGEMGKTLLLGSQQVLPQRLVDAGFEFDEPHLAYAFSK
jgi:uncharacterized protein (TIGR01777 family)